jgi:proteasome component ECM29
VLAHVLEGLGDRMWRAREAACLALSELLPGRTYAQLAPVLGELHTKLLRVLDDVKETVREAALKGWRALCSACVRFVEPAGGGGAGKSDATAAGGGGGGKGIGSATTTTAAAVGPAARDAMALLSELVPLLLETGMQQPAAEVRDRASKQLLKLARAAGDAIGDHAPKLVPALLESLSSLEDPALSYLQLQTGRMGEGTQQALEQARVSALRNSDAASVLDQCLKMMGGSHIDAVIPALAQLLSRGTGLPTRAGTARFLFQLAQAQPLLVRPHALRLLKTLRHAILDERSPVARKAYAAAAAQLARGAPPEPLGELLRGLLERYEGEAAAEEEERLVVASLVCELQRGAPDAMQAVRTDWLPHAFLGRYEPRFEREGKAKGEEKEKGVLASAWEEAYDEAGGGTGAVLLHAPEIFALLKRVVEGTSWALRGAAAKAVLELGDTSGGALRKRPAEAEALEALVAQLRERKWRDKEGIMPLLAAKFPEPHKANEETQPTGTADVLMNDVPASGDI